MSKKSAKPMSKQRPSLRNLVSELLGHATQCRHPSEISREVINGQLKRCAAVLCSEACQDFAVEELNLWFQVAARKGTHEMKALMYLLDLILTRYVRKLKSGKDDAALEKVAKGCIGENGRSLALILLAYVDYKMTFTKNWMECKDYIKELAYKWESCGFFRSPVIKKVVCEILRDVGADDHMRPETELPKQKTRPLGEIMVPKLPHIERDQRHFYEHLLWDKEDRQGRYEAFLRGMHADTEKERERAKAMEKRRCDRLGRKPRPPDEIEELKEELRQELETELANLPKWHKMSRSGVEKLRARMVGIRPLGQKRVPYATEFSQLARFFPEPEERMSGGVPFADRALLRNSFKEPAQSPAAQEPTEKPASARVSGTKKAAVAAEPAKSPAAQEPAEKPASARVSGTKKAAVAAEPAKSPAAQEPTEKPASARVSGTKKAAVAAEPAKSPAAQEPTEKPASGRVSGRLRGVKRPRPEPAAPAEESQKRGKSDDEKSAKDPSAPPSPAPENQPRKIKWKGGSLHVWPVLGDHRCLFRAVVRGLFDPYNTVPRDSRGEPLAKVAAAIETRHADLVRKALCDHMQLNKALVEPSIERPGDATKYIQSMRSPTTWADQICTKFLPDVIKCPIHVQAWNREKKRLYDVGLHLPSQGTDEKRGTIFLYYNGRTNYELVSQQQIFKRRSMEHETVSSASSGSSSIEKTSDLRADKKV